MAEDTRKRPDFSDQSNPASGNDPLAELARLIGQSDPFSEARREPRAPVPRAPEPDPGPRFDTPPAPASYPSNTAPHYEQPQHYAPEPPAHHDPAPQYEAAPRYADHPSQRYESQPSHQDWPGSPPPATHAAQPDFFAQQSQQHAPQFGGHHPDAFADLHGQQPGSHGYPSHLPGFDPPYQQQPQQQRPNHPQPFYMQEAEAGSMPPPHDDEFYDDAPRGSRRRGLLTVAAVFALAIVGTAGAFGYRSLFGGPGVSGPPPVIRASGEPNKVAPPPQAPEQSTGKFSYDRFGDAGKDERVVRREETPVDIPRSATPRTVFPGAPVPGGSASKSSAAMASANPPSALGEPRKVRTVPIRPDQGDAAANAPVASEPASASCI